MTKLLRRVFSEAEKLPIEEQDAIAARWLAELEDERGWESRFAATTDDQWDRMAAKVRRDAAEGRTRSLEELV